MISARKILPHEDSAELADWFCAMLICLPSLYIFACVDGWEARFRTVAGVLFASICLISLLLIGFAPVAWIFSQSTDSIPLMAAAHLIFCVITLSFGFRLLAAGSRFLSPGGKRHLKIWQLVFILVSVQMTSTLCPIIGRSAYFFPREKKFFITHWRDTLAGRSEP